VEAYSSDGTFVLLETVHDGADAVVPELDGAVVE